MAAEVPATHVSDFAPDRKHVMHLRLSSVEPSAISVIVGPKKTQMPMFVSPSSPCRVHLLYYRLKTFSF
jgi:hypothetical protein